MNDIQIVKYTNLVGDSKQVIIKPVGYFRTLSGLGYLKKHVNVTALLDEFMTEDEDKKFNIELLFDVVLEANEHLKEAVSFFTEDFDVTDVRDLEDVVDILKAIYKVNKVDKALKNLMGSRQTNAQ